MPHQPPPVSEQRRFSIVMEALERGERDAQLLDGREFDALYWRNARRQLSTIKRRLEVTERERDALKACL